MSEIGGRRTDDGGRDRLDLAIDRAVREMLDVEQAPGFRARVLDRLPASGSARPAFGFRLPALGLAVAAAIVILTVLLPRERVQPQSPAPITSVANQPSSSAPEAGRGKLETGSGKPEAGGRKLEAGSRKPATGSRQPAAGSRQPEAGRLVAATTTDRAGATIEIDPLRRLEPIEVAPLTQSSIAPAEIAMRPLSTISELQIAPLNPPDRRN